MSTGDPAIAAQHAQSGFRVAALVVPSLTLDSILDDFLARDLHWLKIDVEGMERDVLDSWDSSPVRPWILIVESTRPNSQETTHHEWEGQVFSKGYEFAYFDGLNRFYTSQEHPELKKSFRIPANYFDDFSLTEHSIFSRHSLIKLRQATEELSSAQSALGERSALIEQFKLEHAGQLDALAQEKNSRTRYSA